MSPMECKHGVDISPGNVLCEECLREERANQANQARRQIGSLKAQMDALTLFKTRLIQKYSRQRAMSIVEFRLFVMANLEETIKEILNA